MRQVSEALGLQGESWYVQADDVVHAYIALEGRLDRFPVRDLALLWDEDHGWSAAIEAHSGQDLQVVDYFGRETLPRPAAVAEWVDGLLDGDGTDPVPVPVSGTSPSFDDADDDADASLATRLAAYAVPALTWPRR
jgi:hypothetical protein